jgi:hypothetical protein
VKRSWPGLCLLYGCCNVRCYKKYIGLATLGFSLSDVMAPIVGFSLLKGVMISKLMVTSCEKKLVSASSVAAAITFVTKSTSVWQHWAFHYQMLWGPLLDSRY